MHDRDGESRSTRPLSTGRPSTLTTERFSDRFSRQEPDFGARPGKRRRPSLVEAGVVLAIVLALAALIIALNVFLIAQVFFG